jgi:DNA-binding Xre family transcriptional regulator
LELPEEIQSTFEISLKSVSQKKLIQSVVLRKIIMQILNGNGKKHQITNPDE